MIEFFHQGKIKIFCFSVNQQITVRKMKKSAPCTASFYGCSGLYVAFCFEQSHNCWKGEWPRLNVVMLVKAPTWV